MGVDIETYRGRIGCFKGWFGCDVVTVQCNVHLSYGMKTIGAVVFIGVLLIIGGIEVNPGPTPQDTSHSNKEGEKAASTVPSLTYVAPLSPQRTPTAECPVKEDTPQSNTTSEEMDSTNNLLIALAESTPENTNKADMPTKEDTTLSKKKGVDAMSTVTSLTAPTPEITPTADGPTHKVVYPDAGASQASSHADSTVNQGSEVRAADGDGSETSGSTEECFLEDLLQRLGLSAKYPEKITSNEIVCVDINSPSENQKCSMIDVPYILLKKIISVNCEARDTIQNNLESVDSEQNDECPDDTDNFFNDVELLERNSSFISPLDIFHIVLACCDPMLKQNLYRKLYLCKMALPFITKFNTLQSSRLEIWPLRTLHVFDSDTKREENVLKVKSHFLGFARLGRPSFSKSRLLNCLLSGESNAFQTFYNYECPSGAIEHNATQGLVESFWLQTNVKTSVSSKTVTYFNMRGDLSDHFDDKSRMFIQQTCQCLILITDLNEIETRLSVMTAYLLKFKHVLFVFHGKISTRTMDIFSQFKTKATKTETEIRVVNTQSGANFFDIVCSLAKRLKSILAHQTADSLENKLKNVPHITTDENEELNKKGKQLADDVLKAIRRDVEGLQTYMPYKLCITPVSAIESKKIADCIKKIEKEQSKEKQNELFNIKHLIQTNQIKCVTPSLKCFLCKLKEASQHQLLKRIFLGWIQVQLGEETSHFIQRHKEIKSEEQDKYLEMKKVLHENNQELKDQKQKMVQAIEDLENSMFGVDHLFREISHIYNTIFELNISKMPTGLLSKDDVTAIFADFIIEGESFEVIDGDSMYMAKFWINAVTQAADKKMNNARIASLAVLGLQSSGKSTMLNTMFGVHFSVSTGRCTKGINAQLLPVRNNGKDEVPFKYVMVLDSEGLRAPELDDIALKADRDNALATFVTGLGDLTLLNIMGENYADMKDILQIIVHALLRLKLANSALRTGQACVFVHHNVTDKSARDNMKDGFLKLVQTLDSVTVEAAKAEGISDITRFCEVIKFDVDENVFHVPNLWQGIVPMNRVNTGYSDGVLSIKSSLMKILSGVDGKSFSKLSDFTANAEDLWKGILCENFVFSFRNSLEIKAYCSLEEQIQKVIWDNEINEKKIIFNNMQKKFSSCTDIDTLEKEKEICVAGVRPSIAKMKEKVIDTVTKLFEKNEYPDIVIKWKGAALININHRCEQHEIAMRNEIDNVFQRCFIGIETASTSREKTEIIREESMKIAKHLQGKALDDNTIKKHFDDMWSSSMGKLEKKKTIL